MSRARLARCAVLVAALAIATAPAAAAERFFLVRLPDGSTVTVRVDVAPGLSIQQVPGLPGTPVREVRGQVPGTELRDVSPPHGPVAAPADTAQPEAHAEPRRPPPRDAPERPARRPSGDTAPAPVRPPEPRRPSPSGRTFFDTLPGPTRDMSDLAIRSYRIPLFLLPIYQEAGIRYGVSWCVLAAINEIETDYGRNLSVSSAGAVGWMQFMPATWRTYGVDGNRDGRRDPYNPVDAIFAAARYLQAAGYARDVRGAIFAYNHAAWYVESVLLRARMIAGVARGVGDQLTGLTEGRFPVAARARYPRRLGGAEGAPARSIEVFAGRGAPVVAVRDGVVERLGRSSRLGRFVVLEDANGNRFTYEGLASLARVYPWPRRPWVRLRPARRARLAVAASRLFAHPYRPNPRAAGGLEQVLESRAEAGGFELYTNPFLRELRIGAPGARPRRLRRGSQVLEGTVLGRVGRPRPRTAAHLQFGIQPAGRRGRAIDPQPILDAWRLLESTARDVAPGRDRLLETASLLRMPRAQLERRVLADRRIAIYACGRADVRAGQIDPRVLVTLLYLADSGLQPTVTSLRCGHSYLTSSGNVSQHSSGSAVDIAMLNGVRVLGHQQRGGIVEQAVRRLMALQGPIRPAQIISLLALGGNTLSLRDHADHIHVGFGAGSDDDRPAPPPPPLLGPDQWDELVGHLERMRNPRVRGGRPRRGTDRLGGDSEAAAAFVGLTWDPRSLPPFRPLASLGPITPWRESDTPPLLSTLRLSQAGEPSASDPGPGRAIAVRDYSRYRLRPLADL
jgi:hypothetical protein